MIQKIMPKTLQVPKFLKTAALASTLALSVASLASCTANNKNQFELKKDSLVLENQIKSLERDFEAENYSKYGIDTTIANAKEDLKQIKKLEIQAKKEELNQIKKESNKKEATLEFAKIIAGTIGVGLAGVIALLGGFVIYEEVKRKIGK